MIKFLASLLIIMNIGFLKNIQNDSIRYQINDKVQFYKSSVNTGDFQTVYQYMGVSIKSTKNASSDLNGKVGTIKKIISIKNPNSGLYEEYPVVKIDGFILNYIVDIKEGIKLKEVNIIK